MAFQLLLRIPKSGKIEHPDRERRTPESRALSFLIRLNWLYRFPRLLKAPCLIDNFFIRTHVLANRENSSNQSLSAMLCNSQVKHRAIMLDVVSLASCQLLRRFHPQYRSHLQSHPHYSHHPESRPHRVPSRHLRPRFD